MAVRNWKWNDITEMAEGKVRGVGVVAKLDMSDMIAGVKNNFNEFPEQERAELMEIASAVIPENLEPVETEDKPEELVDEEALKEEELKKIDPVEL